MTPIIRIENLSHRPITTSVHQSDILSGVNLTIEEGAFIAIIGKNGSGKTTLIKHINGLLLPTGGRVLVDEMDTRQPENQRHLSNLVGMVFQNPADQIVASTIEEDIAFGLENLNMPTEEIRVRVAEQLSSTGLIEDAKRPPHLLSGGQIQTVALAGVLVRKPRVILFDEPTSMLDPQTRGEFLHQIRQLHQQGMTIIYVTHHMDEAALAEYVVVLHDGQIAMLGTPQEILTNNLKLYEYGLEVPEVVHVSNFLRESGYTLDEAAITTDHLFAQLPVFSGIHNRINDQPTGLIPVPAESIISFEGVHYTYLKDTPISKKALSGVDLTFQIGAIHAIAGSNGSGKSTLLQLVNGILRPELGKIRVGKLTIEDEKTKLYDVIRKVGLVFQSPEAQFFEVFVGDEIAYGPNQFNMQDIRTRVQQAMAMVGLDFEAFKDRRLETLSGGEKRKVALASTLVLDQPVVMFDEPTAGMDPSARDALLTLFKTLREEGKTILIASHQIAEIGRIGDRLTFMRNGQVIASGESGLIFSELLVNNSIGFNPPLAMETAHILKKKGWPINPADIVDLDGLFSAMRKWM